MSKMKYFDAKAKEKEGFKEIQRNDKILMTECEFCGKNIVRNTWNKKYRLINICQQPSKRFFCSHKCKLRWIFKIEREALT
ncbi:MAG: hypothetical protein ACFE8J_08610 [Candidatus Heimdallarchaeota archaeon]